MTRYKKLEPAKGNPLPPGATIVPGGISFSVFSRHATDVWLQVYDSHTADRPAAEFRLDPRANRTGDLWHIELRGAGEGLLYLWRMDGPHQPEQGHRFNPDNPLIDPWARALAGGYDWDPAGSEDSPRSILPPKCLILEDSFDWGDDSHPAVPLEESIIYECHVRGFTRHESSGVDNPGTFLGLTGKIDYLRELGVTAVELLPVHEFNENEIIRSNPITGEKLRNYWGYSPVHFFSPNNGYAVGGELDGAAVNEFRTMVKALHRAGIEVILDVVFNHTAEGNETGPTLSFRGLDNRIHYMLDPEDRSVYLNFSGCGNTLNCNHPVVRRFIRSCLCYWVMEMHVDGFRFDLASILGRDQQGGMLVNPPLLESIAEDPILRHVKIIAEAWDAGGAYQVGSFPGARWSEWNGRFRDDVRRFWRAERHARNGLASRLTGSSDIYTSSGKLPRNSINFITSHDGFTLNDLVSYNEKHNEANGEENRDGDNHNLSYNFGVEGPTDDPDIERLRRRQIRNFLATLMLSQGVPMMLSGDEYRRTQQGNNNAYCQDNEISWNDWNLLEENRWLFEFTRRLIAFRKEHQAFRRRKFFTGEDHDGDGRADIEWYEPAGRPVRWSDNRPCLACYIDGSREESGFDQDDRDYYMMFNSGRHAHRFTLPEPHLGRAWRLVLDTAREDNGGLREPGEPLPELADQRYYHVQAHSMAVLTDRNGK